MAVMVVGGQAWADGAVDADDGLLSWSIGAARTLNLTFAHITFKHCGAVCQVARVNPHPPAATATNAQRSGELLMDLLLK